MQLKNYDEAKHFYLQAVAHSPDSARGYIALGNLYLTQGSHPEAIAMLEKAVTIDSTQADAYNSLGVAYASDGQESRSENCFKQAIRIKQDFFMAYLNLANYYRRSNRLGEGRHYLAVANEIQKRLNKKNFLQPIALDT